MTEVKEKVPKEKTELTKDKIKLTKWRPKFKRGECFASLIFASRNSGKSYLIRSLLRNYLRELYDIFIIVSDSPDTKTDFSPVFGSKPAIFLNDMNYAILNKIQKTNEEREKKGKEKLFTLIIFDDKVGSNVKNDDQLLQLFTRGRHICTSVIFASQSKTLASPVWVNNSDLTILLKVNAAQQRKSIIDNVLRGTVPVDNDKDENRILRTILLEYNKSQGSALIVDCKKQSNDNLYWYKAP